jgi:hypothetical protein
MPSHERAYFRAISGMNGLMFLMLALAVLNYGSRLETLITSSKQKNASLLLNNDDSTRRSIAHRKRQYLNSNQGFFVGLSEQSRKILQGLDQRIFMITICLSMLFFIISICEFLTAWNVIQKSNT